MVQLPVVQLVWSDQWFNYRKGKINGSKASVCLGWHGKPVMQNYWNQLRQRENATDSETSLQNNLAMKWGTMCEKSAMAHIFPSSFPGLIPRARLARLEYI